MRCACPCKCRHDAGTVALCLMCAANRRAGTSCAKQRRQSPEDAAGALSLAVRKTGRNEYAVPSLSEPGTDRVVVLGLDSISCSCPWGWRVGAVSADDVTSERKRPCRHMLGVAWTGATHEPMAPGEAFRLLGGS